MRNRRCLLGMISGSTLVLAAVLACPGSAVASPVAHKAATVGRVRSGHEPPPSVPGATSGRGFVPGATSGRGFVPGATSGRGFVPGATTGRGFVREPAAPSCLAQLQYGEEVGDVKTGTRIIRGDTQLEDTGWQRQVDAYREAAAVPADQKLKLTIVPWFDPSKGIRRMIQVITPLDEKGEPHGEVHTFRPLVRQPVHVVTYRHGVRHGTEKQWAGVHGNDVYLRTEIPWQNGRVHGDRVLYHPNGKVMTTTRYAGGKETDESRSLDAEGRLERTVTFKGGKKHGDLKDYWPETGKLRRVIPYHNGKVEGMVREYYSDGTKKREVPLISDAMHGVEKVYDAEGHEIETRYWIDGELADEAEFKERFKK